MSNLSELEMNCRQAWQELRDANYRGHDVDTEALELQLAELLRLTRAAAGEVDEMDEPEPCDCGDEMDEIPDAEVYDGLEAGSITIGGAPARWEILQVPDPRERGLRRMTIWMTAEDYEEHVEHVGREDEGEDEEEQAGEGETP